MRFAYADPPYPGQAKKHYSKDPSGIVAKEVDHSRLIDYLERSYDGWALSTNEPGLDVVLPICRDRGWTLANGGIRMGMWIKPFHIYKPGVNPSYGFEPILFRTPRKRTRAQPTLKNFVVANVTLRKGTHGAKPEAVNHFILDWLNLADGDTFADLYPGSGSMQLALESWQKSREIENIIQEFVDMSNSKSLVPAAPQSTATELAVWQVNNIRETWERTQQLAKQNPVPYAATGYAFNQDCIGYPFAIVSPFRYSTRQSEQFGEQPCVQCAIRFLDMESGELGEPTLAEWKGNGIIPQTKKLTENEVRSGFWTIRRVGKRGTFYLAWFDPSVDTPELTDGTTVMEHPQSLTADSANGTNGAKRGPGRPSKQLTNSQMLAKQQALATVKNGSSITDVTSLWSND